ncbi:hypothetical protein SDC9_84467 [bioreactor metagenome]|uniref:HTH cro/C1-type domain-containing protein n=1 Tax=bioreactor metagenome TaxID=1076179 RepID=A0A644ZC41_9ZZZZ
MEQFPDDWQELAKRYKALGTIEKAATALGLKQSTARQRLVRMGVERNAKGPSSWRVVLTGSQCREKRLERGLTQPVLAEMANVTVATISNFENGKRTPRVESQERIASALGLASPDALSHDPNTVLQGDGITRP